MGDKITRLNQKIGQAVSWLNMGLVLLTLGIVILRYIFGMGWVGLQEVVIYIHAGIFMLAGAHTLAEDQHVKVDIVSSRFSKETQRLLRKMGVVLFLFPFCGVLLYFSFSYVVESWKVFESSGDAGGLPGVFVLKSLLILYPILLWLQGLAILLPVGKASHE